MPSAFIKSQAELLRRTEDVFLVLQNLRDKYTVSSFPSQMTRVKEEWYSYRNYHPMYHEAYAKGLKFLRKQGISRKFIDQYEKFGDDGMKVQLQKQRVALKNSLTGSTRTDHAIAELPILPEFMRDYKLTLTDANKTSEFASKNMEKRSQECVEVGDCDALIEKCRNIVKKLNEDAFVTAAALGVLCGRRSIEILKIGNFSSSPIGAYACRFSGAAKKRIDVKASSGVDIPLLVKFKYVTPCLDYIRTRVDVSGLTNGQVNSRYSHKLGDASRILMDSLDVRFHDLRAIYGTIAHQAFSNTWSINMWLKRVLIHDTIDTSIFYSRCKIDNCGLRLGEWSPS